MFFLNLKDNKIIFYKLCKFSIPLILSGILQQLYNWIDTFIIGNVEGEFALAAIGSTTTIVNLYLMLITGFTLGLSVLIAQKAGSGDKEVITKIITIFSFLFAFLFMFLAIVGILESRQILNFMHTTADTIDYAEVYLKIIFIGIPFLAVYNVYGAALRGIGDSKSPLIAIIVSSVVNTILDLLFVVVFKQGVKGAATATIISQMSMTIFLALYTSKKYSFLRIRINGKMLDKNVLKNGLNMGFAPMLQSCISAFGNLLLQKFMNGFGTQTVAAITTAYRIDTILLLPIINLGVGVATLVAQSYGAGEKKEIRKIFINGIYVMIILSLSLTVLIILSGGFLISMFGVSDESVEIGRKFFKVIALFYVVNGLATVVQGYLEGIGDMIFVSMGNIVSLASRIFLSYSLSGFLENMVIAYAEGISWIVLLLIYILRLLRDRIHFRSLSCLGKDK